MTTAATTHGNSTITSLAFTTTRTYFAIIFTSRLAICYVDNTFCWPSSLPFYDILLKSFTTPFVHSSSFYCFDLLLFRRTDLLKWANSMENAAIATTMGSTGYATSRIAKIAFIYSVAQRVTITKITAADTLKNTRFGNRGFFQAARLQLKIMS